MQQIIEPRSLQQYSKSAKSLSAKAGKGAKGSKMGDHEWREGADISWVSSKFGKSKAGKAKSAKSVFGSKTANGIKGTGKSAKSESYVRSGYGIGSKSAKGIKGKSKSAKSLEGKSEKYIEELTDATESLGEISDVSFEHERSPFDGDESKSSSAPLATLGVTSAANASIEDADSMSHISVGKDESSAGEEATLNNDGAPVQSGANSETFEATAENPPPRDEFNSVQSESVNEITIANSSLGDNDAASGLSEQGSDFSDLADTVASSAPISNAGTIPATVEVNVNTVDVTKIGHDAEMMGENGVDMEAME